MGGAWGWGSTLGRGLQVGLGGVEHPGVGVYKWVLFGSAGGGADPPVQGAGDPLPSPVSPHRARPRMAEGGSGDTGSAGSLRPGLPGARGLLGRRPAAPPLTPGRLPSIRSRDLTLGGVKKVSGWWWYPQTHPFLE